MALADNDVEGRELWDEGNLHKGGVWKPQTNGVHWCLLRPTDEFQGVMERFQIPRGCWPFTIENAFPAALRREALADGAYAFADHKVQSDLTRDPEVAQKIIGVIRDLDEADDAYFYLMAPTPRPRTLCRLGHRPGAPAARKLRRVRGRVGQAQGLLAQLRADAGQPPQQRRMA